MAALDAPHPDGEPSDSSTPNHPAEPRDLRANAHNPPSRAVLNDPIYRQRGGRPPVRPMRIDEAQPTPKLDGESAISSSAPTPAQLGFRMPAEFEPQDRVWVCTPTNPDTWPGCLDQAQDQHAAWCGQMQKVVSVKAVQSVGISPEDAWIRDFGPIFVIDDEGNLAFNTFRFNAWGGKYPPWDKMDATPRFIGDFLNHEREDHVPFWEHQMVLEGGSFGVNGKGALLTTEACLLHPNRNPSLSKQQIEANLAATLGVSHVIWMPAGIEGDDTDGHQDDIAQWVSPDTIVCVHPSPDHHDFPALDANWKALQEATDQDGHKLNVAPLPVVDPPLYYPVDPDYKPQRILTDKPSGGGLVPASYANFLISNGHLFLPVFGRPTDDAAIKAIEQAAPHLTVVPIRAEWLVVGLGAMHCLSQQQPKAVDIYAPEGA